MKNVDAEETSTCETASMEDLSAAASAVREPALAPMSSTLTTTSGEIGKMRGIDFVRDAIREMKAYTLEPREAEEKLDQNESPFDFPRELKAKVLERVARRPWNLYPDFELTRIRTAIGKLHGRDAEEILAGNGSNELIFATLATLVAPGRDVIFPSPTFPLYEKIATIAGGRVHPVGFDVSTGRLPVDAIVDTAASCQAPPVIVVCSPNNPTGGTLQPGELDRLLATGAAVVLDRAYGDFAFDELPSPHERLFVFSTFSKAWGLAGLRIGWVTSTSENIREIRKVKLPYNLNFVSEEIAVAALEAIDLKNAHVREIVGERERMSDAMRAIDGVIPYPSQANFIAFETLIAPSELFQAIHREGILIRNVSSYPGMDRALRVSVGTRRQNDRFIEALKGIVAKSR